jgi:signal transduction histidine kinase
VISTHPEGERTVITVEDHGIGIAAIDSPKIFKRFERIPSSQPIGGMGLGLYITHQIVEAHHGTIRMESEPGKGSKFIIELPLVIEISEPEARAA